MSSREEILSNIQKHKSIQVALPEIPTFNNDGETLAKQFEESLKANAGVFKTASRFKEVEDYIQNQFPDAKNIVSLEQEVKGTADITLFKTPQELNDIDLVILKGTFGVAENAAIWLPESTLHFRALPFITQHLFIILSKDDLVPTMHHAYQKTNIPGEGYGVFIAGPSKTADIEQNLVIGAHGSRSLTVFLM